MRTRKLSRVTREIRAGTQPGPTMRPAEWRRAAITLMHSPDALLLAMPELEFEALGAALGIEAHPAVMEPAAAPDASHPAETREVA